MSKTDLPAAIFQSSNRGLLLDLVVLLANLFLMPLLVRQFEDVVRGASADDPAAIATLLGCGVALMVLAPLGATLSRWHHHQHRDTRQTEDPVPGCLFNPIFYFCLMVVVFSGVNAFILQSVYGRREPDGTVFVSSIFLGLALIIVHTWLVYRYFSPPKNPPRSAFLRSRKSEFLGDACLFANMLLFQVAWNALSFAGLGAPSGVGEAVLRLLVLVFLALLIYFPPRMFYLADDIGRPLTWLMILLANSPVIVRMVMGS